MWSPKDTGEGHGRIISGSSRGAQAVDGAVAVVGDVEAAVGSDCDVDGAAPAGVGGDAELPAGGELLDVGAAVGVQQHADEVRGHGNSAVPGAVQGDEHAVGVGPEGEAEGSGVGLHLGARGGDAVARAGGAELGVDDTAIVAAGPAEVVAVADEVQRLRWLVVAQVVAAVIGGPQLVGARTP